ncbi:TonB-dependent receptor domain-containing protein [Phenylobacterium sp.]|jgi:iron complex outermembrane receptor protein|uniref:TonB-dependent receptor domain-containing protein n=1 Tax=Phenylobacterium sp. TaxID=1871053 RepID=UPI002F943ADA
MSSSRFLCASSAAALLLAAGLAGQAAAQVPRTQEQPSTRQGPSQAEREATEVGEVVVTGSFIAGTPEDAPIPVEAVTLEELRQQGSPSTLDLVKNMSEVAGVAGEANRNNLFAIGAQSINLRGVGSSRTVVVFNGRRLPEQYSASVGRFNNVALIPNAAIGRVETLKDGGATTYGADAVGGVQNYITRRNLDGLETNANYRYIPDSDGDWDVDVSWGKVGDSWNAMLVGGYIHRSELDVADREFALQHYMLNPAGWSTYGSPGAYTFVRSGQTAAITPIATLASGNRFQGDYQMGITGVARDPACGTFAGFRGWSATPSPVCYFQSNLASNLVEETNTAQLYGEVNYEFGGGMKLHVEGLYYYLDVPHIPLDTFVNVPLTFPIAAGSATGATQVIGGSSAYAVAGGNPAVRQLLLNMRNSNGSLAFGDPNTPGTQAFQIVNGGRVGLNTATWRPFGYGGNPLPELDEQHNNSDTYRLTAELSGDVPEFAGFKMRWSTAATFNYLKYRLEFQDMLVDRLQSALNGLGGPNCTGTTPGANGCQYFNPFSSGIASNIVTGEPNPGFVSGLANDPNLIRWMYVPAALDRQGEFSIYDVLLSGQTPFHLWSEDPVQMAVGAQYRYFREEVDLSDLIDRQINPCATVGAQTCVTRTGPLVNNRGSGVTGFTRDQDRRYPVVSAFFEIQAPVLDNLVVNLSGRYEKFYSDVSPKDNAVFVPQVAVKWQVNDWLAFRGTAGESFSQVDPPPVPPGGFNVAGNVSAPTAFGGTAVQFTTRNYPNLDVRPETGFNYNVGAIFQIGNFRGNVDYYNIRIDDLIRAQTTAQIINALVQPGQTGATALLNCSSELLTANQSLLGGQPFVQLAGGASCVQGTTTISALAGGFINFFGTQGAQTALVNGGTLQTSGIDANASWRFDEVWGGTLTLSSDLTYVLTYEASDYVVGGITVAPGYDGIGQQNELTGRNNQRISQWVGSIGVNFRKGRHNFNWNTRARSSLINDDLTDFVEANAQNANIGNASGFVNTTAAGGCVDASPVTPPAPAGAGSGTNGTNTNTGPVGFCSGQNYAILTGMKIPTVFTTDVSYQLTLPWDTTLSVTVQNLFDREPAFSREALGYDASTGSALGRTVRFGVRKTW